MRTGTAKVVEYWEAVLKCLHIFKAKARLKEIHAKMLCKHLQRLKQPSEDAETYSQEPILQEKTHKMEEEAGSLSPELLHSDENEEAIDPEEDRAILERKHMAMKAMGAMEEGDALFGSGAEFNLDSRYDQTHYNHDNPPPKIVQGYKFNIFYPDLVEKKKAPIYTIENDGKSWETCIIRLPAGPPYEDIAFRIVNKV